jgi:hypothetical protein
MKYLFGPVLRRLGIDIPSNKLYLSFLHNEILVDLLSQNPFLIISVLSIGSSY